MKIYFIIIINTSDFYFNVIDNINLFLSYNGFNNLYFNGEDIIFKNNYPYVYISNEYTYDYINNKVYRNTESYNEINNQIYNWINQNKINNITFGVNIIDLMKYLKLLGDEIINLYNYLINIIDNANDTTYNIPLKFYINKIWNKYFSLDLQLSLTYDNINNNNNNIYSGFIYTNNFIIDF